MAAMGDDERREFVRVGRSASLRDDLRYVSANRHNPVTLDGRISLDRLVEFLTEFNQFLNHAPKPFRPMIDTMMKL